MSLDHPPGAEKIDDISTLSTGHRNLRGRERLWAEIAKCDLVCLNCHALRTHERWLLAKAGAKAGTQGQVRTFRRAHPVTPLIMPDMPG